MPYLEEDEGTPSVSSGGGVRKAKLFFRLTEATVRVTADEDLDNSSKLDLFALFAHPNGEGSGTSDCTALRNSESMYFCGRLYADHTPIVSRCPSAVAAAGACLFSPQPSGALLILLLGMLQSFQMQLDAPR